MNKPPIRRFKTNTGNHKWVKISDLEYRTIIGEFLAIVCFNKYKNENGKREREATWGWSVRNFPTLTAHGFKGEKSAAANCYSNLQKIIACRKTNNAIRAISRFPFSSQ